jgi:hypothetical protein
MCEGLSRADQISSIVVKLFSGSWLEVHWVCHILSQIDTELETQIHLLELLRIYAVAPVFPSFGELDLFERVILCVCVACLLMHFGPVWFIGSSWAFLFMFDSRKAEDVVNNMLECYTLECVAVQEPRPVFEIANLIFHGLLALVHDAFKFLIIFIERTSTQKHIAYRLFLFW